MPGDGDSLFRAICEQPQEDTPRLMYADWLQENGQPERAEFIRLQCEAQARIPGYLSKDDLLRMGRLVHEHGKAWRDELPIIFGVQWNALFVRGFIEFAEMHARVDFAEVLARMFAATPLVRLIVHDLDDARLLTLLECPFIHRLTTLAMPDLVLNRLSAEVNDKLLETSHRLETTRFAYNRP